MSEKDLTSMKDESPDLQKQMGCISGFFQLFDRHRFLTGQRSNNHSQNTPIQGGASNRIKELNNTTQKAMEKNVKVARENQQFSTESSGTSMSSSSRSSSMSSLEFNRTIHIEPTSVTQTKAQENTNSGAAMKQLHSQGHNQALDFCDIVKGSMHRDVHALSIKTGAKEEKNRRVLKYIDSPRPLEPPKSVNSGAKVAWDSPRLSYDSRDTQDTFKYATKHKELPRLSLDSREGTKSRGLPKGPQRGYGSSSTMQEPETSRRPSSSVVAKLMGLEAFPDCTQTCEASNKTDEYNKQQQSLATSTRTSKGSVLLNQSRRDGSMLNVMPYTRFSQEPSPWRQSEASQGSELQGWKRSESSIKASHNSLSVYGEIEKRVADLEFKNSGKDLRALKQILDAMQRYDKESLDISRDLASNSPSDNRSNSSLSESSIVQSPRIRHKDQTYATLEVSNSIQGSKSPIVVMKPAKSARTTNNPGSTNGILVEKVERQKAKSIAVRHQRSVDNKSNKMRNSKLVQSSMASQIINGERTTDSSNTGETRGPGLQKKFGLERRSPPTSPLSDSSSINRRQHYRPSVELSSPSSTARQKFFPKKERNEHFSYQRRDLKHEVDVISPYFDSKSMDSCIDVEVIHSGHSENGNSNSIQLKGMNQNNAVIELSKETFIAEKIITTEQPSPVSVLDDAFYREEPPSPVKKKSYMSKDLDEALSTYDSSEENSDDLPLSSNTAKANFSDGTNDTDLKTQNLVQIFQEIDYNDERFTNQDPDHKYISEILLESGLLSSPSSIQAFHSSSHALNPKLFLALEKIKENKRSFNIQHSEPEKMQRKLIFDVASEILAQKLILESSILWCQSNQPTGRKLRGQQLLNELCTEIDELQQKNRNVGVANEDETLNLVWEELMQCHTMHTDSYYEIPNVVLDVERLIFKDLVTEIVKGELANHCGKHCRKLLFPK